MKTSLPSAIIYGINEIGSYYVQSDIYHEENLVENVEIFSYRDDSEIHLHLVKHKPDVIITIGFDKSKFQHVALAAQNSLIASKWIHVEDFSNQTELANLVVKKATDWACSVTKEVYNSEEAPYFSIFTPTYKTEERIFRAYESLKAQTYPNWEWVIFDDSPTSHLTTWGIIQGIASKDHRVKIYRMNPISGGNIGEVKRRATSMANSRWLLELDHDDALISTCLEDTVEAIKAHPTAGFFYTDVAEPYEDGEMRKYTNTIGSEEEWYANPHNTFVWGYGGHEIVEADGKEYLCHVYPNINPKTIRFNIGMPNHARIWRKDVYDKIGRHNRFVSVADDYELIVRTFLETKMVHIRKLLYLQYNNRNSTVDNNAIDINRKARLIRDHYDKAIHDRIIELGGTDWDWHENIQRSTFFQFDRSTLQYYENESILNEIFIPSNMKIHQTSNLTAVQRPDRPTLAFATMCKNEEHVIGQVLEAVAPYIDYLVVADTGSTDRTLDIVREYMERHNIPGEIHVDEWEGFDKNKNKMMSYVYDKSDYVLHLDADDILAGDFSFNHSDAGFDNYFMTMKRGNSTWKATVIYDNRLQWKFCGVAHTVIKCVDKPMGYSTGDLCDRGYVIADGVGSRAFDPKKFLYDAERLTGQFWATLTDDPDGLNARSVFYTAQSYMDYGQEDSYEQALKWNKLYLKLKDTWIEEYFEAQMRISLCMMRINSYTTEEIIDEMEKAIAIFPDRAEPHMRLGRYLNSIGQHHAAYQYLKQAQEMNLDAVKRKYILFVDDTSYNLHVNDELSVACYWTGRYQEGINLVEEIIANERWAYDVERLQTNIQHFNNKLNETTNA